MKFINQTIKLIKKDSSRPIENEKLLRKYLHGSIYKGKTITFYNWECLPRIVRYNSKVGYFLDFNVDLKKVFRGFKENKFIELPRVVEKKEEEKRILLFLKSLNLKFRFVKIIADTNLYYLSPQTLKLFSPWKIKRQFLDFKKKIKESVNDYPVKVQVKLATDLFGDYLKKYEGYFKESLSLLKNKKVLKRKTLQQQERRIKDHVGIKNKKFNQDFSKKVIASYGAEGLMFGRLSKIKKFSNCVWLNIEEADQRTVEITNFLRKKYKVGPLPIIFLEGRKVVLNE